MTQTGCSSEGMEPFALRVIGDSMSPEFDDGHIIVVDPGYPLVDGAFAVIENNSEILFGQYFETDPDGTHMACRIEYLKPGVEPVALAANFRLKGIVTQRNGRRRKDIKRYDYLEKSIV